MRTGAHGIRSRNNALLFRYYTIVKCALAHMESEVETTPFCFDIISCLEKKGEKFPENAKMYPMVEVARRVKRVFYAILTKGVDYDITVGLNL